MAEFHPIHWFNKANANLSAVHSLYDCKEDHSIICYLSQQAVEKFLKAYLYWKGEKDVIFTHNLLLLNTMYKSYDKSFENIISICDSLNDYAVDTRYPSELFLDDYKVSLAMANAKKILSFGPIASAFAEAKAEYEKNYVTTEINVTTKPKFPPARDDDAAKKDSKTRHGQKPSPFRPK